MVRSGLPIPEIWVGYLNGPPGGFCKFPTCWASRRSAVDISVDSALRSAAQLRYRDPVLRVMRSGTGGTGINRCINSRARLRLFFLWRLRRQSRRQSAIHARYACVGRTLMQSGFRHTLCARRSTSRQVEKPGKEYRVQPQPFGRRPAGTDPGTVRRRDQVPIHYQRQKSYSACRR